MIRKRREHWKMPFDLTELLALFEFANAALNDSNLFDQVGDSLDLNDEYLSKLHRKLARWLNYDASPDVEAIKLHAYRNELIRALAFASGQTVEACAPVINMWMGMNTTLPSSWDNGKPDLTRDIVKVVANWSSYTITAKEPSIAGFCRLVELMMGDWDMFWLDDGDFDTPDIGENQE